MQIPYMIERDGVIIEVNEAFLELSGFSSQDLLNKLLQTVWRDILRITIDIVTINANSKTILFTKSLDAIHVSIQIEKNYCSNEAFIMINEVPNSGFEDKNQFVEKLISDDITGIGVYVVPGFMLIKANQTYLNYLPKPYNKKELVYGKCLKDFIPNFEGSLAEKVWNNVVASNKSLYFKETQRIKLSDEDRYWDNTLAPISEDGKVKYIVSMLDDVTERVLNRERLLKHKQVIEMENEHLHSIFDNLSSAVFLIDKNGNYLYMNSEARKLSFKDAKKLGDSLGDFKYYDLNGKELEINNLLINKVFTGKRINSKKLKAIHKDGQIMYFNISCTPMYDANNEVSYVVLNVIDITADFENESIIRKHKKQLEATIENISDAFMVYDKEGNLTFANAEARKLYPKLQIGQKIGEFHRKLKFFDLDNNIIFTDNLPTRRALRGEKVRNERIIIELPYRTQITEVNATPIFDEDKRLISIILSHRDISELIRNQQEIKTKQEQLLNVEKEKNEALEVAMKIKDEFLYLITHEFKTPTAVINLALQAIDLICKGEISEKVRRYLNTIKQNTNRQLRLINNLLDITRMSSGNVKMNMSNFDVVYVVESIVNSVQLYAEQKNVELKFITNLRKKEIYSDEEKLERILLNLLSNALKFTPSEKSISVILSTRKHKDMNMLSLCIKDEGVGIPLDKHKIIFERFGQADTSLSRQAEGTGLGLHLVKLLVNALDGEISLKSIEGKGSEFTVLLPIIKPIVFDEITSCDEGSCRFISDDIRIIQAATIEFSDIYF